MAAQNGSQRMTPETTSSPPSAEAALAHLAEALRRDDRDRYLTVLLAPATARAGLLALYGFNLEIARIRDVTTEEIIGRMRLQWWRDRLDEIYQGDAGDAVRGHPVAAALAAAIRDFALDRAELDTLIAGRERDLDDRPPGSLRDLVSYAEQTAAPLPVLALRMLNGGAPPSADAVAAARETGVAQALAGIVRAVPHDLAQGRRRLPADLCAAAGVDFARLRDRGPGAADGDRRAAVAKVAAEVAARGRDALARARRGRVERRLLPALLPAALAARDLRRLARHGFDPFAPGLARPDGLRPLTLFWAAMRGRV